MNPVLQELVRERSFEHRGERYPLAHNTPVEICARYAQLIEEHALQRALEIGTLFGLGTLFLADALSRTGGRLDTMDIRFPRRPWLDGREIEDIHEVAERLVAEAGLSEIVTFLVGHSNQVLAGLIADGRRYDFALVDGSHVFAVALLDFISVDRLLAVGGFVALDDVGAGAAGKPEYHGGPSRLLEAVFVCGRYEITPWSANVAVCRKVREVA